MEPLQLRQRPKNRKRVAQVNPADQREVKDVPHLRIVDQKLWDVAHQRRLQSRQPSVGRVASPEHRLNETPGKKFLLSGLLTCGRCGGGYTIVGKDRYGCATRRSKGTCDNGATISRQKIEARVLTGLKDRLAELIDVQRRIDGMLRATENVAWNESIGYRLKEFEVLKANLASDVSAAKSLPEPVELHPNAANIYSSRIAALETSTTTPVVAAGASKVLAAIIHQSIGVLVAV